ncbi:hypothetical protein AN640_04475 [Candidatus Epulonipiscium fishelsonii]|uniref:Uncharacterized protein n=1 Tax=Candidatus Epulonipiscium fishelsonii TaxID=77094 RepID=A0ACC8XIY7_9FIRM|nr:hypothetical protein AN640_04475 [Epulopiscium sp. SCG-D08WGA-EpuloA1]
MLVAIPIFGLEPKDFNGDGVINQQDVSSVVENLDTNEKIYDVNNDGEVGVFDLAQTYWSTKIDVSNFGGDIKTASEFYNIMGQIDNLFTDKTYTSVDTNTEIEYINLLIAQLTKFDLEGSFEIFFQELQLVKDLLETGNSNLIGPLLDVNQERQFSDNLGGILSDLQPIGAVGMYGEDIIIYVEADLNKGMPELVFSQYYGAPEKYLENIKLREGRNIISVPIIDESYENGGSIYVKYDGKLQEDVKLHLANINSIPMLDLKVVDEAAKDKIKKYIRNLIEYVEQLDTSNLEYNPLNSTEIGTSKVLASIPASQVLEGLGDGDINSQVEKLYEALQVWDNIIDTYYKEFGFTEEDMPTKRLNIRYMPSETEVSNYIGSSFESVSMLINETKNGTNGYFYWLIQFFEYYR